MKKKFEPLKFEVIKVQANELLAISCIGGYDPGECQIVVCMQESCMDDDCKVED